MMLACVFLSLPSLNDYFMFGISVKSFSFSRQSQPRFHHVQMLFYYDSLVNSDHDVEIETKSNHLLCYYSFSQKCQEPK